MGLFRLPAETGSRLQAQRKLRAQRQKGNAFAGVQKPSWICLLHIDSPPDGKVYDARGGTRMLNPFRIEKLLERVIAPILPLPW